MSTRAPFQVWRGEPTPLGATLKPTGVNFALYSEQAEKVELCFFDQHDEEIFRYVIESHHNHVWHCFVVGMAAGQRYGYRVHGPYRPLEGQRFNPSKLLIDPYAKATSGPIQWDPAVFGYTIGHPDNHLSFDERDSAPFMPKSVVVDSKFDWENDVRLNIPWNDTIIYETHVKGFTKKIIEIPEPLRGTYAGLAHPASISYLKDLGVTAVELLPIHKFTNDEYLQNKGLSNYWGYNTIGYFAPDWSYAASQKEAGQVQEFKKMVKALHAAGLEVILDVVYNHTAEGNHLGPTLSFRGVDNLSYYRVVNEAPQFYMDYTGCGNTLNVLNHNTLRLIMDSLRYWVLEMHVDGFRFDLASALARGFHEVNQLNAFFGIIQQDPVLSQVKLIAEPWDLGEGGYQVGQFPPQWTEWNDKYRDTLRKFWKGDEGQVSELASRLMGSSDLYNPTGRRPYSSINFLTAHDGFTLRDLVSYNGKHNEANQEENRDGNDTNHSWNCGVEGETQDEAILQLRNQQKRNFLASLFLSQGVPMLVAGDEWGRTQNGNNNAYCQDNEISWLDWERADRALLDFARRLIALRKEHRLFHRRNFFDGAEKGRGDVIWFNPEGQTMTDDDWTRPQNKTLAAYFDGRHLNERDHKNNVIVDDNFVWVLNASHEPIKYRFPDVVSREGWMIVFNTADALSTDEKPVDIEKNFVVPPRSTVLMMQKRKLA